MAKKSVEEFLIAGGESAEMRLRYDTIIAKENFVTQAVTEGYDFNMEEFDAVINESGDSFDLVGNPAKRGMWWR